MTNEDFEYWQSLPEERKRRAEAAVGCCLILAFVLALGLLTGVYLVLQQLGN